MIVHPVDDEVVPVHSPEELRGVVGERVVRARRRRRVRRAGVPAALAAVVAVVLLARVPGGVTTTVGTPATEGRTEEAVEVPASGPSPTAVGSPSAGSPAVFTPPTSVPVPGSQTRSTVPPRDNATELYRSDEVRLAVVRDTTLYELGPDMAPVRALGSDAVGGVAWSPDGRRLAYIAGESTTVGFRTEVRVVTLASMSERVIASDSNTPYFSPSFSADGTMVAFARSASSTSTPPKTDSVVVVVDLNGPEGNDRWEFASNGSPSWLPDGRILHHCDFEVLCITTNRGLGRHKVPYSHYITSPSASPDGNWITFLDTSQDTLQVMSIHGGERRTIGSGAGVHPPQWSPDGKRVFYRTDHGLRSVRLDGTDLRLVTETEWRWFAVGRR